ncbi:hypothetical protein R1flu_005850 [Riccia fluitans]|uniref:Reverse transcriptase Ty1/copia-type domain-containing protein n=1 Tax=Riccia fluitans TaxID=41844 RepID=A0ABD1YUW8_9MARC
MLSAFEFIVPPRFLSMLIVTCGVNFQFPHILERSSMSPSLMTTRDTCGFIYYNTSLRSLPPLLSGEPKWRAQVESQIGKKMRCLRLDNGREYISGLPPEFWAEAVNTAAYLVNLSPCSAIRLKTPFELWHKWVPNYSKLRVFGCDALIINKDVSFNETISLKEGEKTQASDIDKSHPSRIEGEIIHDIDHDAPQGEILAEAEDVLEHEEHIEEQEGVGKPLEAQNLAEKVEWSMTMRKEMKSINDNKTWELVELPKDKQMDVVTTFLYGVLDEVIFMRQPLDFARKGHESLMCKLLKSLYGLKQSPQQWNKRFDDFMTSQGFIRSVVVSWTG